MSFFYTTPAFQKFAREAKSHLNRWHEEQTPYLIYGAGVHSRELFKHAAPMAPLFLGFIDQSVTRQREGFMGFPVYSPEEAVTKKAKVVLISSYEYQESMKTEILRLAGNSLEIVVLYPQREQPLPTPEHTTEEPCAPIPIQKKGGRRIAVVDTFFSWPPSGGSTVDLVAVMNHLATTGFDAAFFLPLVDDPLYTPRGRVTSREGLNFQIAPVPMKSADFNAENFTKGLKEAIDSFDPEFVFLGDMYAFKPYLAEALKKYKVIWRSYNYDLVCPRLSLFDYQEKRCPNSFLSDPNQCQNCLESDPSINWEQPIFREIREADIFSHKYWELLTKNLQRAHSLVIYNQILEGRLREGLGDTKKICTVPTGIQPERFTGNGKTKDSHITLFLPGRMEDPAKGLGYFLEIFMRLKEQYPQTKLLTTGKFDAGVEGVESAGWTSYEKMPEVYKQAQICVIPSLWEEPFGIVALEAMASGLPVVAHQVGGLQEIVQDGESGFLVPPDDPGKFLDCLIRLLSDHKLREEMGRKARARAGEYSWEKVMRLYEPLFNF